MNIRVSLAAVFVTLISVFGCGRRTELPDSLPPTMEVNSTTVPVTPWKPSESVLSEAVEFYIDGQRVAGDGTPVVAASTSTTVTIEVPQLKAEDFNLRFSTISYLVMLKDGTPVTGSSAVTEHVRKTGDGCVLSATLPSPAHKGTRWQLAAFTDKNRPVAYSKFFEIK